ncbi:MAG: cell wall hydrolase [Sphingomonadales bacterium]|nr:cell wall hydrolase [Sphingomonadales bacterium]MDE2570594.1 cell wall hydrolase [Sphingomonadales bacterium]
MNILLGFASLAKDTAARNGATTIALSVGAIAIAAFCASATSSHDYREAMHASAPVRADGWAATGAAPGGFALAKSTIALAHQAADLVAASQFHFTGPLSARNEAANCLAQAAWYEAGDDPDGQRAVIQVVLNRMRHPSFPRTACGVVFEGSNLPTGCQFTFTCDGSLDRRHPSAREFANARERAEAALDGTVDRAVFGATHYHADYVTPWWSSQLERISQVGPHIFYRWRGSLGALASRPVGSSGTPRTLLAKGANSDAATGTVAARPDAASPIANSSANDVLRNLPPGPGASGDGAIVIALDTSKPNGRWAVDALRRCPSGGACRVIGYDDSQIAARNALRPSEQRDSPMFLLVRDANSGMVVAWWDCTRAQRPERSQCLPSGQRAMSMLLGDRQFAGLRPVAGSRPSGIVE